MRTNKKYILVVLTVFPLLFSISVFAAAADRYADALRIENRANITYDAAEISIAESRRLLEDAKLYCK